MHDGSPADAVACAARQNPVTSGQPSGEAGGARSGAPVPADERARVLVYRERGRRRAL